MVGRGGASVSCVVFFAIEHKFERITLNQER